MKCEIVRNILTTSKVSDANPKVSEALRHLLVCSPCFYWSMKEAEKYTSLMQKTSKEARRKMSEKEKASPKTLKPMSYREVKAWFNKEVLKLDKVPTGKLRQEEFLEKLITSEKLKLFYTKEQVAGLVAELQKRRKSIEKERFKALSDKTTLHSAEERFDISMKIERCYAEESMITEVLVLLGVKEEHSPLCRVMKNLYPKKETKKK